MSSRAHSHRPIRDLGLIGNRRSVAAVDRTGAIVWYCPGRLDQPSLFGALLDPAAGSWELQLAGAQPLTRRYLDESAVLETRVRVPSGEWTFTDWMPLGRISAICRMTSPAPAPARVVVVPRPGYGQRAAGCTVTGDAVRIDGRHYLYASAAPRIADDTVTYEIPAGQAAWFALAEEPVTGVDAGRLERWRRQTLDAWAELHRRTHYAGPYERHVKDSLRALRLLTFEDNGGIVAAATLGLPEIIGGQRNYDYRYVWLRDAAMIVSALTRAGSDGVDERRFLRFLCDSRPQHDGVAPFPPFMTLDGGTVPAPQALPWQGYRNSRPVLCGNGARDQMQLDALANVLLAAKLIYNRFRTREHWPVVREVADFIATHWHEPDHGIWEEPGREQYTTSKVIAACALGFIADHADTAAQARHWRATADAIRHFVQTRCIAPDGAYAAVAGGAAVDVSAALFPVWDYCAPDTPAMEATLARLERNYSIDGVLYRRHLERDDARREGAFLAGTLWVAQYWVMRRDFERAERILEAALRYANDLGLFAEEATPGNDEMLGNIPQAFVHAALIGMVVDLQAARGERDASRFSTMGDA